MLGHSILYSVAQNVEAKIDEDNLQDSQKFLSQNFLKLKPNLFRALPSYAQFSFVHTYFQEYFRQSSITIRGEPITCSL